MDIACYKRILKRTFMRTFHGFIILALLLIVSGCALQKGQASYNQPSNSTKTLHTKSSPASHADSRQANDSNYQLFPLPDEKFSGVLTDATGCVECADGKDHNGQAPDAADSYQEGDAEASTPAQEGPGGEQSQMDAALGYYESSQEFWNEGNLEKAIDALDQAYELILGVETDDNPDLIQQKDDLRFMISRRILEIYASRYTAVSGNHKAIPLTMNEHVEKEIKQFQGPERNFFLDAYRRSGKYRDMIVQALKEAGMPEELSWLPLIESGFKVRAMSRARALGLWQFIPSTGYKFGLSRDTWIDERLDPEKATAAAIDYLKELHNIFGDWTTVLAAYNCGEGAVLRVIRDQKINYLDNFWDLYERLPRETARYVPRFLAVLHILKEPEKYGLALDEKESPSPFDIVHINKQAQLSAIAEKLDVSSEELSELNPELRRQVTPDTLYSLKVPQGTGEALLSKLDEIPEWSPPKRAFTYHRVKNGETLSDLAARYRTSVRAITSANNIRRKDIIRAGRTLKIPLGRVSSGGYHASGGNLLPGGKYRIRKGDSLWIIAQRFNTDTKTLKRINNLDSTTLYVGQLIKVVE